MGIPLKVSLGISAYRADLRGLVPLVNIPAVAAFPAQGHVSPEGAVAL